VALIRFLMMTGCRFGEAVRATWDQFDLERGVWTKPSPHTKAKKQHSVPLSAPARALLASLERKSGNPLVFASPKTGRPLVTVKTAWAAIRRDAGLDGVRIHDLRHSFASVLASSGASLQLIGSLLGHTQLATTARYAHLADDARREAVERAAAALTGTPGEVVLMRRKG
jgi:integrase